MKNILFYLLDSNLNNLYPFFPFFIIIFSLFHTQNLHFFIWKNDTFIFCRSFS